MPLRVAPCPKCKSALVYGERACRTCGQTFQYAEPGPPMPTAAQIVEALQAAGVLPAPPKTPATPATISGLDTGRYDEVADPQVDNVQGFMPSSIFAAFTPSRVRTEAVNDLDVGRFEEVGAVAPAFTPDLEPTARDDVGDVMPATISGIFRSDIYATPDHVPEVGPLEGFEPTASAPSPHRAPPGQSDDELERVLCTCGELHRLPRCPSCGVAHPARK